MKIVGIASILVAVVVTLGSGQQVDPFSDLQKQSGSSNNGISSRIVGGSLATTAQFPWMAAIAVTKPSGTMFCGGSLIHPSWVLTSAHCLSGGTSIYVRLGSNKWASGGQLIAGLSAWYHPSFNPTNYNNNIGVIKLQTNATISKNVTVIKLLPRNMCCDSAVYQDLFSGWGYTNQSNPGLSADLKYLNATEITNLQCISQFLSTSSYGLATIGSWIVSSIQCTATSAAIAPTVWTGDDGGPLVRPGTTTYQVGVLSISDYFPIGKYPVAYTRVCHYLDILQAHTGVVF